MTLKLLFNVICYLSFAGLTACTRTMEEEDGMKSRISPADALFSEQLSTKFLAGRELNTIASGRSADSSIALYADFSFDLHINALEDLLATAGYFDHKIDAAIDSIGQADIAILHSASQAVIDSVYLSLQVHYHKQIIDLFRDQLKKTAPDLFRNYSEKYVENFEQSLARAEDL